ncbi:flagellar brake protein [Pararobbsia silviterrae]|nr:flagellar brake protein [Pararobbsia silviterrae]
MLRSGAHHRPQPGIVIEPTSNATLDAAEHDDPGVPFGEPLDADLVDSHGVIVLMAGSIIPSDAARALLVEHFGPIRTRAHAPSDAAREVHAAEGADDAAPSVAADAADASDGADSAHARLESANAEGAGAKASVITHADLGLEIGALLRLQPPKNTGIGALGCRVIGVAPNHSIFITPPTSDGRVVDLVVGERLSAVYVSRRAVYGFVCTVQSTFRQPFEYALLSAPGPISRLRARSALRARVRFFALMAREHAGAQDNAERQHADQGHRTAHDFADAGVIRNLSASGMNVSAREGLAAINDVVRLSFCLHTIGHDQPLEVRGRVRHVRRDDTPGHVSYGLQLQDLSANDRLLLSYYVLEQSQADAL